eukprot:Skav224747  [mRNA]  locus=scaffold580:99239:111921:- [translate_table: standard]
MHFTGARRSLGEATNHWERPFAVTPYKSLTAEKRGEQLLYVGERVREVPSKGFISFRAKSESTHEVGRVQAILDRSRLVVTFPSKGTHIYRSCDLVLAKDDTVLHAKSGDVFGEISLLCNTRHLATFRASNEKDVTLYAINRSDFKECAARPGLCKLDIHFAAKELDEDEEGRQRQTPQWYIVKRGSALVSKEGPGAQGTELWCGLGQAVHLWWAW